MYCIVTGTSTLRTVRKTKRRTEQLGRKRATIQGRKSDDTNLPNSKILTGYVETAVIPAGARHIRVEEVAGAPNYLALKSPSGKYYLNGHWYIQWSGEYEAAGTTVHYTRKHNKETFVAQGPTSEEMHIMVCGFLLLS